MTSFELNGCVFFFFLLKTITNMSNNAIKVVNKGCTNEELERKGSYVGLTARNLPVLTKSVAKVPMIIE